jgi:hypothetical protein
LEAHAATLRQGAQCLRLRRQQRQRPELRGVKADQLETAVGDLFAPAICAIALLCYNKIIPEGFLAAPKLMITWRVIF